MTVKKQTVWLVTMLTLMVVLSAYYIVTGPIEPVTKMAGSETKSMEVGIKELEAGQHLGGPSHNYFLGYQLQRSTLRSKMAEEYYRTLANPDATKMQQEQANAKLSELMKVEKKETVLEDLIRKEGFNDAVVLSNDTQVDVIVQSKDVTNAQAVKLIHLVKQQMEIPEINVSIANRP